MKKFLFFEERKSRFLLSHIKNAENKFSINEMVSKKEDITQYLARKR